MWACACVDDGGRVGMLACGVVEVQRCGDVGVCGSLK